MSIADFIEENREELVESIHNYCGINRSRLDDEELELWIANDEGLYNWARSEGVEV